MGKSGVYAIINIVNGKVYVGSTKDFERRWYDHRKALCLGIHYNKYLQRSWDKYGEKAFEFSILEHVGNLDDLHIVEQFWMDEYREEGKDLYNMGKYADNALRGTMMPQEQKTKIGETLMGHPVLEESKRKKAYTVFDLLGLGDGSYPALRHKKTGEIIPAGSDLVALCLERKLSVTQMARMVCRICYTCSGWQLLSDPPLHKTSRPYPSFIHMETGEIIPAGVGLATLCRKLDIPYTGMSMVVRGEVGSHYGWMLKDNMVQTSRLSRIYPSFINIRTGKVVPSGRGFSKMCQEIGVTAYYMRMIENGEISSYDGWVLASNV